MSRATQGVTLINLDDDEKLAGLQAVAESVEEETLDNGDEQNGQAPEPGESDGKPEGGE